MPRRHHVTTHSSHHRHHVHTRVEYAVGVTVGLDAGFSCGASVYARAQSRNARILNLLNQRIGSGFRCPLLLLSVTANLQPLKNVSQWWCVGHRRTAETAFVPY
jgi:hypothetical protein